MCNGCAVIPLDQTALRSLTLFAVCCRLLYHLYLIIVPNSTLRYYLLLNVYRILLFQRTHSLTQSTAPLPIALPHFFTHSLPSSILHCRMRPHSLPSSLPHSLTLLLLSILTLSLTHSYTYACTRRFLHYYPSAFEDEWVTHIHEWQSDICARVRSEDRVRFATWYSAADRVARENEQQNTTGVTASLTHSTVGLGGLNTGANDLLTHSLTHSLIGLFTRNITHSLICLFTRNITHSLTHSLHHSLTMYIISLCHSLISPLPTQPTLLTHSLL